MQKIATEMQKVKNKSSIDIMNEIIQFLKNNCYNLCQASRFIAHHVNSTFNGSESVSNIRLKI